MADTKISALTALTGANVDTASDVLPIVDISAATTKKILVDELRIALLSNTAITNTLSGDVALNNTGNYFDGPSCAQGTTGVWFASGSVVVQDTAGAASFKIKLWDGTTVIASANVNTTAISLTLTVSVSGFISAPTGNIRISVNDSSSTSGKILFNASGNSKDATLTVIRIG